MNKKLLLLFLSLITFKISAQELARNPYLQAVTTKSIVIRWRTDVPTSSKVSYALAGTGNFTTQVDETPKTEHIIKLSDLKPDTRYDYKVGNTQKDLASGEDFYFTTAPTADTQRPLKFWVMGDFGDLSTAKYISNQTGVRDAYLARKKAQTDLWLWLGDMGYGANRDGIMQAGIFNFYGNKIFGNTPISYAPGNHEYDDFGMPESQKTRQIHYFDIINPPVNGEGGGVPSGSKAYFSFNIGNVHVISLDSYGMDDGVYRLYHPFGSQYQWLVKDLEANKSMWTVIAFHHPPYTKRSHDSDNEGELRLIRETLVPLFDKYKVDLVLTGHSHVYERSYLIKDHLGPATSFDYNTHAVQKTKGLYTAAAKPFINKDDGTVYVVAGSAGRLDAHGDRMFDPPHQASAYANLDIGGSLMLTVQQNRLDAEWICADGVIRDRFTMLKNVNKINKIDLEFGSSVKLKASWPGTSVWSNGIKNQQEIEITPTANTVITVRDSLSYLEDRFEINLTPRPVLTTSNLIGQNICSGKEISVSSDLRNTTVSKWSYVLELSDVNGSFTNPLKLAEGSSNNLKAILPENLSEGSGYKVRVRPNVNFFEVIPSASFAIKKMAEAKFEGPNTVQFDTTINLSLSFKGSLPISYQINDLGVRQTNSLTAEVKIRPTAQTFFRITQLSNACGSGKIDPTEIKVLAPLGMSHDELKYIKVFPNPVKDELTIENTSGQAGKYKFSVSDLSGRKFIDKSIYLDKTEVVSLQELPFGIYFVELKSKKKSLVFKILKE